jgi:hypothetical protein
MQKGKYMATIEPFAIFDEVLEFLASAPTQAQIIAFHPSPQMQQRVSELLEKNRQGILSSEEHAELDEFTRLEHFMRMLKIKARQKRQE